MLKVLLITIHLNIEKKIELYNSQRIYCDDIMREIRRKSNLCHYTIPKQEWKMSL